MIDLDRININFFKKYLYFRVDQEIIRTDNKIKNDWNYATINHTLSRYKKKL